MIIPLVILAFLHLAISIAPAALAQSTQVHHVGVLFFGSRQQPHLAAFKLGLRDLGYVEGKNITLELRYADGDRARLAALADELLRQNVDVVVTTYSGAAQVVRERTKTVPIVLITGDAVASGMAQSLAKPGGNVTGLTNLAVDLSGKRLDLLKEVFPKMTGVSVLWSPLFVNSPKSFKEVQDGAQAIALRLNSLEIRRADEIEAALAKAAAKPRDPLLVILDPLMTTHSKQIVQLALQHRVPGTYPTTQFVEEGGLMSYGANIGDIYRRAATYVDKILHGAQPANLPIERPIKFEFVINLKTAKQIGLTIPPNVLVRADRVIR